MATIRPSSDLRNNYNEIAEFCKKYNEPVFITKNGRGDLVVLSNAQYEHLIGKHELYRKLEEAMASVKAKKGRLASEVFGEIEREFGLE